MTVMRRIHLPTRLCLSTACALILGAGLLAMSAPARAGDDNPAPVNDVPIDTRILRNILHDLGLKNGYEKPITYDDRPPLVIPPSDALPPPVTSDTAIKNPNWPKDPDVARAKQERKARSNNVTNEQIQAWRRPLSPSQMTPDAETAPRYHHQYGAPNNTIPEAKVGNFRLSPSQLGDKGYGLLKMMFGHGEKQSAQFTGEPPRLSLTEPPPGYQTPSPDQPYGNGQEAAAPKAENYYLSHPTPSMTH